MAEETTTIRQIILGQCMVGSTINRVIRLLRDLAPTEEIYLALMFTNNDGFRLSEAVELRELVLEKKSQIQHLEVYNCFEIFVKFY